MNKRSVETLKRVQENDPKLTELNIGKNGGIFAGAKYSDFSLLGVAIEKNSYLKRNKVLKVYQEKNNLTTLRIAALFSSKGHQIIIHTLKKCTNLKVINLSHSDITDEHLLQIVPVLEGNHVIEKLNLSYLRLHRLGPCRELATLLRDPNCNLHTLNLECNFISNEGLIAIANGLTNNTKFKQLHVDRKSVDQDVEAASSRQSFDTSTSITGMGQIVFSRLSCDTSSNNGTAPTEGLQSSSTTVPTTTTMSTDTEEKKIVDKDDYNSHLAILLQKQEEAWKRVSMFILGEELTIIIAKAGKRIVELLHILVKTVKVGCCSNVRPGICMWSRISRAIILSICKLPLELNDDITRKELDRIRIWLCKQINKFIERSSGKEIQISLPEKLSKLITKSRDITPPWGEDDIGILLQQPSPSWIKRINILMLMGYKVVLANFNDVARFSRKNLKVVHDDISRLLCPSDNGDDKVREINEAMDKSCTGSEQVDDDSPPVRQESKVILSDSDDDTIQTDNDSVSSAHVESMRDKWLKSPSIEQLLLTMDQCVEDLPKAAEMIVSNNIQYMANKTSYTCKATDHEAIIYMLDALYINGRIHRSDIEAAMSDFLVGILDLDTLEEQHCYIDLYGDIFCSFSIMQALTITWLADSTERIVEDIWNGYTSRYSYKFLVIDGAMMAILRHIDRDYIKEFDAKDRNAHERVLGHSNLPYFEAQLEESAQPVALVSAISKRLYPQINDTQPDMANKIAGMLLETDTEELTNLLGVDLKWLNRPKVNFGLKEDRKVLKKVIGHSKYSELSEQFKEFDSKQDQADLVEKELFKQPPQEEDCPICFLQLPLLGKGKKYKPCCGKIICIGCVHAHIYDNEGNAVADTCPFCSNPEPTSGEEILNMAKARMELNDTQAMYSLGDYYARGEMGLLQDYTRALELWHRAGELGHAVAYYSIGDVYRLGIGVEEDKKKARHYYELAAMKGHVLARGVLGNFERLAGNMDRALKHFMIAVKGGGQNHLGNIHMLFVNGYATKDDYTAALRAYQAYLDEVKSYRRDEAAAYDEKKYKYY